MSKQGNITNNNNILEQSIGVEESEHGDIESIPEEQNDPDKNVTIGDINITSEMNMSNEEST